jgi:hypothetical protein
MLPHTLATIGDSLMRQTGWNITILAGGPTPANDGAILTYLYVKSCLFEYYDSILLLILPRSHAGTTKSGQTFENFLGKKAYDENILLPFDKFLHASFCKSSQSNVNTKSPTYLAYS